MTIPNSLAFSATVIVLGTAVAALQYLDAPAPETLRAPLASISSRVAGWVSLGDTVLKERTVRALAPTEYLVRTYEKDSQVLDLFIAFYAQQRSGESVHSPDACLPGEGWEIEQRRAVEVPVDTGAVPANLYSIRKAADRAVVLYWFQSRRRIVANEYAGKLFLVRDAVLEHATGGSIVRLTLRDDPVALRSGIAFASKLIPEVARCL